MPDGPRRSSHRLPLEARIRLLRPGQDEVLEATVLDVAADGLFVAIEEPLPPGTTLPFRLRPGADWQEIAGTTRVVWVRHKSLSAQHPRGMGLRFLELDEQGRKAVAWLVAERQAQDSGRPGAPVAPQELRRPPETGRRRRWWVAAALALALATLIWILGRSGPPLDDRDPARPGGSLPAPAAVAPPPAAAGDAADQRARIEALLEAWARAWSEQRVDDYLAFYSPSFQPPPDTTLEEWRALRRRLLEEPGFIQVSVDDVEISPRSATRAVVTFTQTYVSDRFSDVQRKRLELALEDDAWLIVREHIPT